MCQPRMHSIAIRLVSRCAVRSRESSTRQPDFRILWNVSIFQRSVWPVAAGHLGAEWSLVRCLIQMRRHTEVFHTAQAAWQPRSETAWYVCTPALSAAQAHHAVRDHWSIENALHHVRDVVMSEDASRIRIRPGVFAQLRTCALNLLRHAGHHNILAARQTIGWSEQALLHLCQQLQR